MRLLRSGEALDRMGDLMAHRVGRVLVADIDWQRLSESMSRTPALLRKIVGQVDPDRGREGAGPSLNIETLSDLPKEERREAIESFVEETIVSVLALPPGRLDRANDLLSLGFDSLMAVEVKNRIESGTGVLLPTARLLDQPSVREIADEIASIAEDGGLLLPQPGPGEAFIEGEI